jgi:hypothetical protein
MQQQKLAKQQAHIKPTTSQVCITLQTHQVRELDTSYYFFFAACEKAATLTTTSVLTLHHELRFLC